MWSVVKMSHTTAFWVRCRSWSGLLELCFSHNEMSTTYAEIWAETRVSDEGMERIVGELSAVCIAAAIQSLRPFQVAGRITFSV